MNDATAIVALWDRMALAWVIGSADAFAAVFAPDVDYVSVRGEEYCGRAEVASRHARLFAGVYLGTAMTTDISEIRFLAPDIAVVQVHSTVAGGGRPAMNAHTQAVVQRRDDAWSIVAFHNMVPRTDI